MRGAPPSLPIQGHTERTDIVESWQKNKKPKRTVDTHVARQEAKDISVGVWEDREAPETDSPLQRGLGASGIYVQTSGR